MGLLKWILFFPPVIFSLLLTFIGVPWFIRIPLTMTATIAWIVGVLWYTLSQ